MQEAGPSPYKEEDHVWTEIAVSRGLLLFCESSASMPGNTQANAQIQNCAKDQCGT